MDSGRPPAARYRLIGLVVAVLVVAGVVGYRDLAPGAISDPARTAYPAAAPSAQPRVYGTLLAAPIVVDGRLRVYAGKRQVYADAPVDVKSSMSPFWSYRRWPAQLVGVVAAGTAVVSQWSDGELVALDATRGTVAWQTNLPLPGGLAFAGRRTGAGTVYDPPRLLTAGGVVIAVGDQSVRGYDAATGRRLWQVPAGGCATDFTGPDVFVSVGCGTGAVRAYDARSAAALPWPQTARQPVGCALGHSGCQGVRGAGQGWQIMAGGGLTAAPVLARPDVWMIDGVALVPSGAGALAGVRLAGGARLWTATAGRVIAVEPGAVHLLTGDRQIVTLDPADGRELSRYPLTVKGSGPFDLGRVYAGNRFLFIERTRPGATADRPDSGYFYASPNVVIAGS